MITEIADARTRVGLLAAATSTPELTTTEGGDVDKILEMHVHATVWAPETSYKLGARVIPTEDNRTGRMFRCVRTGVSDADEPEWGDLATYASATDGGIALGDIGGGRITKQDDECAWVDDGVECDLWNIDDAVHDAWKVKAGRCSDLHNIIRGGNSYDFERIFDHCNTMANKYGGAFIK